MLRSGLMEETAQLLSQGLLDPASPPGRAIGYRQTIEYLRRPEPKTGDAQAFKVSERGSRPSRQGGGAVVRA